MKLVLETAIMKRAAEGWEFAFVLADPESTVRKSGGALLRDIGPCEFAETPLAQKTLAYTFTGSLEHASHSREIRRHATMNPPNLELDTIQTTATVAVLAPPADLAPSVALRGEDRPFLPKAQHPTPNTQHLTPPITLDCLEIIGFKRIRAVKLEIAETGVTVIGGDNAQGKSSILESGMCLLGGARFIPDVPVHAGEKRSNLSGTISDAEGRTFRIKRVIQPDRTTALEVIGADGTQIPRAQEFLDSMKGVLWFDPFLFLRQSPKDQADTLRKLIGLDFSALDKERVKTFDLRTQVGRERDRAKGHAESLAYHPDAPDMELSASDIQKQLAAAVEVNGDIDKYAAQVSQGEINRANLKNAVARARMDCDDTRRQIKQLQDRLAEEQAAVAVAEQAEISYAANLEAGKQHLADMERSRIDTTALAARMTEVESVNRKVRDNIDRAIAYQKTDEFDAEYRRLTEQIAAIDEEKRRSLAEVQWPVEGLGFPEDGSVVLYNDFPLAQAAGAEKLRVAVSLAMLMSGGLRLAFVDCGEQLDVSQLALLDATVREMGGQILMARVSDGEECSLIIHDGMVAPSTSTKSTKTNGKDNAA